MTKHNTALLLVDYQIDNLTLYFDHKCSALFVKIGQISNKLFRRKDKKIKHIKYTKLDQRNLGLKKDFDQTLNSMS